MAAGAGLRYVTGMPRAPSLSLVVAALGLGACTPGLSGDASPDAQELPPYECDVEAPTVCPDPPLTYADVEPIIRARCVGCHDEEPPEWPLTSYRHVADWNVEIRTEMLRCTMPPRDSGVEMPTDERERILTWILCGFPE